MILSSIIGGASAAMGLASGVKGMFDAQRSARKQRKLLNEAKASESAWYKRNYYGDYMNSSMARAALKRVEKTLHARSKQNRGYSAVNGATPELELARNRQSVEQLGNVATGLAAQDSANKSRIDAIHQQNMSSLRNNKLQDLRMQEQSGVQASEQGFDLLNNALLGVNWGKEK